MSWVHKTDIDKSPTSNCLKAFIRDMTYPVTSASSKTSDGDDAFNAVVMEQMKAATQNNPSLARELVNFLTDESPDPNPVTQEDHPVFYDASKNPGTYHYVPKAGMGIQKDGTKLHMFDYEVSFHTRSKDFFGDQIDENIRLIKEARASGNVGDTDDDPAYEHVCALASIIVAAYSDLVLTGNDDMTSYLYLCQKSVWALSLSVKKSMGHLAHQGEVALGLVTELVATSKSSEELFKTAVVPRDEDVELVGIEALIEDAIAKAYRHLTPSSQTKGILLNNGVDINTPWAGRLIQAAPNLDRLCDMDFTSLNGHLLGASNSGERAVLNEMYAGMLGSPMNTNVPPARQYMLENNPKGLEIANALEQQGYTDLSAMTDKDIYNVSENIRNNIENLSAVKDPFSFVNDMMSARQSALNDKLEATGEPDFKKPQPSTIQKRKMINSAKTPLSSRVRGGKIRPGKAALMRGGSKALVSAGKGAAVKGAMAGGGAVANAGGLLASAGGVSALNGPIGVALALAPILKGISDDNERKLNEEMAETSVDRKRIESEVGALLAKVSDISTESDAQQQSILAKELLQSVRKPGSFTFSKMQGMGLQSQLEALATNFGSTDMAALKPYNNDAELVAAVDSGRALTAVALFVDDDEDITTPQRQLLQTPRYVRMMGPSCPFNSRTHRTTSETEAMSFVTASSHSGFSTASKTSETKSKSKQAKVGGIFSKAKVKTSTAETKETETKLSFANDSQHKQEEKVKVTQALVSEFTYMPTKAFCLKEGGLILSDYAYYRLQKIMKMKVKRNGVWVEEDADEATKRYKAQRFLIDFGSHIPFGVQTLGGVFVRTMKITTKEEASLTEMYSSATQQLTVTNTEASKETRDGGGRVGAFGIGASGTSSRGFESASSNGTTQVNTNATGSGQGTQKTDANFQSTVTCFGPNAATQDMLYQQLMSNNATWTVIDRGEPNSYLAIWDLVDYIGQGGMLQDQCMLLKELWQESALMKTSASNDNHLLSIVMDNYDTKKAMYDLVDNLINCMVPTSPGLFTRNVADQFEKVIRAAAQEAQVTEMVQNDPIEFIKTGFAKLDESPKFELVKDNPSYKAAEEILSDARGNDWANHFSYYTDSFRSDIVEKGKPHYLLAVCLAIFGGDSQSDTSESWKPLFEALLTPPDLYTHGSKEDQDLFAADLKRSLMYRDEVTQKCCLHYVLHSKDPQLIGKVYRGCPEAAALKDNDGNDPYHYAIKKCSYSGGRQEILECFFGSKKWRLLSHDHPTFVWDVNSIKFLPFEGLELESAETDRAFASIDYMNTNKWVAKNAFENDNPTLSGYTAWGGRKDNNGEFFIGMEFTSNVCVGGFELRTFGDSTRQPSRISLQCELDDGRWYTVYTLSNFRSEDRLLVQVPLKFEDGSIQINGSIQYVEPSPPPPPSPIISIKSGDEFYYADWEGRCVASYEKDVLVMNRVGTSASGIKTWKCKSVADTQNLLGGRTVSVHWQMTGASLNMTVTDSDTLKAIDRTLPLYFKRISPFSGETIAIRSVSSKYYLDGRNPSDKEVFSTNRNPTGNDKALHWTIEKVDGNFALKSVSSGKYLDGRDSRYKSKDGTVIVTNRKPQGDKFLQWKIQEVDGNYALKSVSSGLYLDGRVPGYTGNKLWLTDRPPKYDKCLQWYFTPPE